MPAPGRMVVAVRDRATRFPSLRAIRLTALGGPRAVVFGAHDRDHAIDTFGSVIEDLGFGQERRSASPRATAGTQPL